MICFNCNGEGYAHKPSCIHNISIDEEGCDCSSKKCKSCSGTGLIEKKTKNINTQKIHSNKHSKPVIRENI